MVLVLGRGDGVYVLPVPNELPPDEAAYQLTVAPPDGETVGVFNKAFTPLQRVPTCVTVRVGELAKTRVTGTVLQRLPAPGSAAQTVIEAGLPENVRVVLAGVAMAVGVVLIEGSVEYQLRVAKPEVPIIAVLYCVRS